MAAKKCTLLLLFAVVAVACFARMAAAEEPVITAWRGRCAPQPPLPDLICSLGREARTKNGERVGTVTYMQGDIASRYLHVEITRPPAVKETHFVVKAGGLALANFRCVAATCSVGITLSRAALHHLRMAATLRIEAKANRRVVFEMPLEGFDQALHFL